MRDPSQRTAHESYSFVCLRCGHGWEQSYRIEHYRDEDGNPYLRYFTGEEQVSSPLAELTCRVCGGHRIRLMRAGAVSAMKRAKHPWPM